MRTIRVNNRNDESLYIHVYVQVCVCFCNIQIASLPHEHAAQYKQTIHASVNNRSVAMVHECYLLLLWSRRSTPYTSVSTHHAMRTTRYSTGDKGLI